MIENLSPLFLGSALILGLVHALEPGHGKAVMLAYMIDGRKQFWHAVGFGLLSGLLHVIAILGVLVLIESFGSVMSINLAHEHHPGDLHISHLLSGGILIALGAYLLIKHHPAKQDCCSHHHPLKQKLDLSIGVILRFCWGF